MRSPAGGGAGAGAGTAAGAGADGGGVVAACCGGGCTQPNSKPDNKTAAIFPFIALLPFATEFRHCYSRLLTEFRDQEQPNSMQYTPASLHCLLLAEPASAVYRHPGPAAPRRTKNAGPTVASRRYDLGSSCFGLNIRNSPEPIRKNSLDEQIGCVRRPYRVRDEIKRGVETPFAPQVGGASLMACQGMAAEIEEGEHHGP